MSDSNRMISVPCELLEQALDAAAAVGMQDVADELDRILTPSTTEHQREPVAVLYANGTVLTKADCGDVFDICCKVETPLYTHADPGEVERLRESNTALHQRMKKWTQTAQGYRAQLAELQSSVREYLRIDGLSVDGSAARNKALTMLHTALAASSEREARHD